MFRNWRAIFSGDGGMINSKIPIYSFDGRDVLADPFWSVTLTGCLFVFVCLPICLHCWLFLPSVRQASEEHLARLHRQGSQGVGQTLRDVASRPRVRHGTVIQPDLRSAPGPADAKLLQRVHRPLHWNPQKPLKHLPYHFSEDPIPATENVQHSGKWIVSKRRWCFV